MTSWCQAKAISVHLVPVVPGRCNKHRTF